MRDKNFDYGSCIKRLNSLVESIKDDSKKTFDKLVENIHFDELSDEELEKEGNTKKDEEKTSPDVNGVAFFNDIRKICLNGISQLSEDPTSVEYETLKRIWDLCDKVYNKRDK